METSAIWPTILEINLALGERYRQQMESAAAELNLPGPVLFGLLLPALLFEPQPISPAMLAVRNPYSSNHLFVERLAGAANQFYFSPVAERDHAYFMTAPGKNAARHVISIIYKKLASLQPLPAKRLERLATQLMRVVYASLDAQEPPGKWCIQHSRNIDPGPDAPVMVRIDQCLTDLAAYRDDAHLAAWKPYGTEGHTWEAFTFLWRGEVSTLDELNKALERRGHSREIYRQSLLGLERRGWIQSNEGVFAMTSEGKKVREHAEELTDLYFFAPWSCLKDDEVAEISSLLQAFLKGLIEDKTHP